VKTVYHLFSNGRKLSAAKNCLGTRQYNAKTGKKGNFQWETYDQVAKRIDDFGSGLIHLLFDGDNQIPMPVGIWAKNRPEWTITDIACASQSLYTVALYETLGKDAVEYVANHAELSIIVCSSDKIATLLQMKDQLPHLEYIISMDSIFTCDENGSNMAEKGNMIQAWAKEKGVQLFDFKQVEILGQKKPQPHRYPDPSAISCIMYTSGTTDMPKVYYLMFYINDVLNGFWG
jgi:long-chain acyl-CoA synthetase